MHYSVGPFDYIKYFFFWIGNKITTCCGLFSTEPSRIRSASTFSKFDDLNNAEVLAKYGSSVLSMKKLTEPYDILWKNMSGVQGHFLVRRLLLFVAGLLIILFVSSPTVLFANIKKLDEKNYFDFDWIEDSTIASFAKDHLPAFIILNINLLLLQILDYAALYEKYETHSLY